MEESFKEIDDWELLVPPFDDVLPGSDNHSPISDFSLVSYSPSPSPSPPPSPSPSPSYSLSSPISKLSLRSPSPSSLASPIRNLSLMPSTSEKREYSVLQKDLGPETPTKRVKDESVQLSEDYYKRPTKGIKDVVMVEALPFLPAKALSRCKAVSKLWLNWIEGPFLVHKQSTQFKDFSGLICQMPGEDPCFIPLDQNAHGIPNPSLGFLPEVVNIKASCSGLLCCRSTQGSYYICNPATPKQWKQLPEPDLYHDPEVAVALAFEPSTLKFKANYELACVVTSPDHPVIRFEIYSSRSSSWRTIDTTCCELSDGLKLNDGFYHEGTLYWETFSGIILTFHLRIEQYGIMALPQCASPNGVLTVMHGELCYILPQFQNGDWVMEVYGGMNMNLKQVIALNTAPFVPSECRALACVHDNKLLMILGPMACAYHVREQKMITFGPILAGGYAKYLPYINSLVSIGHPMVPEKYRNES